MLQLDWDPQFFPIDAYTPIPHCNAGSEGVRPTGTWLRKIDKNPKWIIYHSYHLGTTHTSGMQRAGAY